MKLNYAWYWRHLQDILILERRKEEVAASSLLYCKILLERML